MGPVETQRLRINRIAGPLMGLMLLWLSGPSSGQNYPERPIVLTVAYAPGGAPGLQARGVRSQRGVFRPAHDHLEQTRRRGKGWLDVVHDTGQENRL